MTNHHVPASKLAKAGRTPYVPPAARAAARQENTSNSNAETTPPLSSSNTRSSGARYRSRGCVEPPPDDPCKQNRADITGATTAARKLRSVGQHAVRPETSTTGINTNTNPLSASDGSGRPPTKGADAGPLGTPAAQRFPRRENSPTVNNKSSPLHVGDGTEAERSYPTPSIDDFNSRCSLKSADPVESQCAAPVGAPTEDEATTEAERAVANNGSGGGGKEPNPRKAWSQYVPPGRRRTPGGVTAVAPLIDVAATNKASGANTGNAVSLPRAPATSVSELAPKPGEDRASLSFNLQSARDDSHAANECSGLALAELRLKTLSSCVHHHTDPNQCDSSEPAHAIGNPAVESESVQETGVSLDAQTTAVDTSQHQTSVDHAKRDQATDEALPARQRRARAPRIPYVPPPGREREAPASRGDVNPSVGDDDKGAPDAVSPGAPTSKTGVEDENDGHVVSPSNTLGVKVGQQSETVSEVAADAATITRVAGGTVTEASTSSTASSESVGEKPKTCHEEHANAADATMQSGPDAKEQEAKEATEDRKTREKCPVKAPFSPYVPPGRRQAMETADAAAAGLEGMGLLWPSVGRTPVRASQRARPTDGGTSPSRPAPARVAAVVSGGMSAYGANISEYSEQMPREQVEKCTALITFPTALPRGQREPMMQQFTSRGALVVWACPDEALATFATPALARQAVRQSSTVLTVELLSEARVEKRKGLQRVELERPGRPPADVSSASRLISGALGIRKPRETGTDTLSTWKNAAASASQRGVRGRGAKYQPPAESTDSWDT